MTLLQAALLGLLQGVTELFPISSLGHSILLPAVFHWNLNENDPSFLVFLVATHFATALALLAFFWREWVAIIRGALATLFKWDLTADRNGRLAWLLAAATVPAGVLGLLLQNPLQRLFGEPMFAALFLAGNGVLLFGAELLRRRASGAAPAALSFPKAVGIGLMQCLALLPGFSRTGATLSGGLLAGLSHENAARFSFLLATPIIFAAAALKLPTLFNTVSYSVPAAAVGALFAAAAAFLSVKFLTRYFKGNTLMPFAAYCFIAGIIAFFIA